MSRRTERRVVALAQLIMAAALFLLAAGNLAGPEAWRMILGALSFMGALTLAVLGLEGLLG